MSVSTQILRIKTQVSDQKDIITNICNSLQVIPETTGGTPLEINKINLGLIYEALDWSKPIVIGSAMTLTQVYGATKNDSVLEVE